MKRLMITLGSIGLVVGAGLLTLAFMRTLDTRQDDQMPSSQTPTMSAERLISGLDHPWDIDFLPDGTLLFTERSGTLSKLENGNKVALETPSDVRAVGEGGLTGLAVDPEFEENRFIYACLNSKAGDIRVARWVADEEVTSLSDRTDIITDIPAAESGRHSGCQLAFGPDKNLWVGTGDAADESQPQDRASLGGKILRVTRDGQPAADNPDGPDKRVYSYGHRNTQALAFYDNEQNGSYGVSVEHGSDRDDEVNPLTIGNFGWAPGNGYDESVPMTDLERFPDAVSAVWSSGSPTNAVSGAAFLKDESWGRFDGWLAVSVLKDQKLLLLNISGGSLSGERSVLENEYGRLRAATLGPDGALYVSTDNGDDDALLRITPAS